MKERKKNEYEVYLLNKYKNKISSNKKGISEILKYLELKFSLKEIDNHSTKYKRIVENTKMNALNCEKNKIKKKSYSELNIIPYEVIQDISSEKYYQSMISNSNNELIYIIIETHTEYIYCNCDMLLKELYVYQGITNFDIENATTNLFFYLRLVDELKKESF
ncbi:hypothetical protein EDC18_103142 [Natranaerovirga pectinivora]|uniref:Uncharacterized protein n=1 Tax=Natranaerovirga pectinivora TaxID=682400 RepID=A0A4R3MRM7_9FIRM|nr:hypothetical protein [Natranaerovirga pectinivora]TCT15437.1 hypothetical protein EDC18_103142 [Natranaerovirga pectinivora]